MSEKTDMLSCERRDDGDASSPLPNEETLGAIADAEAIIARGGQGFASVDELLVEARAQ